MTDKDITSVHQEWFIFEQLFKWMGHFEDPIPADPLSQTFAQDDEILRLNVNSEFYGRELYWNLLTVTVVFPCFLPLYLFEGWYCSYTKAVRNHQFDDVANTRHLILRENSLVYRVEMNTVQSYSPGCWTLEANKFERTVEMVFSLDDPIELVKLIPSYYRMMDTFIVVQYKNATLACVYATGADIDKFIEKFKVQRGIAKERCSSREIDQNQRTLHEVILDFHKELITTEYPKNNGPYARNYSAERQARQMYRTLVARLGDYTGPARSIQETTALPLPTRPLAAVPLVAEIVREAEPVSAKFESLLNYSVEDVQNVLISLGLRHLCISFEKEKIDGVLLKVMDDESLKKMGVSFRLDRKKILAWVLKADRELSLY